MVRLLLVVMVSGGVVCQAEQYWVRYDASSGLFPEEAGWTRYASDPAPERWLEDGTLFIDSRRDWFMWEPYSRVCSGMLTPAAGETFVVHWRVKVHDLVGYSDPGIVVRSDSQHLMSLSVGMDFIELAYGETRAPFAPCEWHEFMLRSEDMVNYELEIDGVFGFAATALEDIFTAPLVTWGDVSSHRSLSQWDYVEFGIVPEPSTGGLFVLGAYAACLLKRSAGRRGQPLNK